MRTLISIEELIKVIPILGVNEQAIFQLNGVHYGFMINNSYNPNPKKYLIYELDNPSYVVYLWHIYHYSIQNAVDALIIYRVHRS